MVISALRRFLAMERASSWLLIGAALLALVITNSALGEAWLGFWKTPTPLTLPTGFATITLPHSLGAWVKDGLMSIFFVLVGLEMKRELVLGHLRQRAQALLPLIAALGGMVVPAALYAAFNAHNPATAHGWAIPCATDIAFALGILGLLGNRVPPALKVLLLAIAIFDDLGAILIIALFYSAADTPLQPLWLLMAAGLLILWRAAWQDRDTPRAAWPLRLVLGLSVWLAMLPSGIHPSVGAVALALLVPVHNHHRPTKDSPLIDLEHRLHPWVAFAIMPLFALANAGIPLAIVRDAGVDSPVLWGVALGLLLGKPIGIVGSIYLAEICGLARRPSGISWPMIIGMGLIAGIGFTMSLFVTMLAFPQGDTTDIAAAKAGVLLGSILAAGLGLAVLSRVLPLKKPKSWPLN
jgi:NhaA family Na+:H+ antiporter